MAFEFTDANFTEEVSKPTVAVIDLWAEWCGPCRMMTPIIEELASEYDGKAIIGKLNVDENQVVPTQYNVRGIPTILFFKNGELVDKKVGVQSKQVMQDIINKLLA